MILIINKSKKEAELLAASFRYMGIVARGEPPQRAAAEISTLYRAIVIYSPEKLPDEREYISRIHSYVKEIPIFALTDNENKIKASYEAVVPRTTTASRLYNLISTYCKENNRFPLGEYMLAGINASADQGFVTYFSEPLPLTRTESLILRLLIRAYPLALSPKTIRMYAFKQNKLPEVSGIRTHIYSINKKFKKLIHRNLIVSIDDGYVVMTPMLAREKEIDLCSAAK